MTAPVRINLNSLSLDDVAALREALRTRPGQRSLETRAGHERRHSLIREFAGRFCPGLSRNAQAERIEREMSRYESSSWQTARSQAVCPHRDARRQLLWAIFKAYPRALKARQITTILSRNV
ncbi:hypothetical protein [Bradyrhizobium macuxiense]|uniref:hypothetical protein n=1 Tax=Bradyrhizobium macuxiense TaxID=1755647 RepID=UPI000AD10CD8|nr:hypothetical protein [Bradyrhizobium macuxiense]